MTTTRSGQPDAVPTQNRPGTFATPIASEPADGDQALSVESTEPRFSAETQRHLDEYKQLLRSASTFDGVESFTFTTRTQAGTDGDDLIPEVYDVRFVRGNVGFGASLSVDGKLEDFADCLPLETLTEIQGQDFEIRLHESPPVVKPAHQVSIAGSTEDDVFVAGTISTLIERSTLVDKVAPNAHIRVNVTEDRVRLEYSGENSYLARDAGEAIMAFNTDSYRAVLAGRRITHTTVLS